MGLDEKSLKNADLQQTQIISAIFRGGFEMTDTAHTYFITKYIMRSNTFC